MSSERRHILSRFRFYAALKGLGGDLWSYRQEPIASDVMPQNVRDNEQTESAKNRRIGVSRQTVEQQYRAVRNCWPLLLKSFKNWQLLETKYPGESHPTFDLLKFSEFRTASPFEPNPKIGDLCGLRPLTSDEIDTCVQDAKDGDRFAIERLRRLRHYHRTIYEPISELLSFCSDDLYKLIGDYYVLPRKTFDRWVQELSSHHRFDKPFNLITDLLTQAISLAHIELVFWRQRRAGLDRRTRYFRALDKNASRVEKRCQRLERILLAYRFSEPVVPE